MRIVLLITDLERGGAPLRVARLARGLRALGMQVAVGCLAGAGPVVAELERDGIRTFACGARSARDVGALLRLRRWLLRLRPDLLHSFLTHANVAARVVGAWVGTPVISSTATVEVERGWHAWIERRTRSLDRGHTVNSRVLAQHVVHTFGRDPRRVFITPPAIGLSALRELREPSRRAALRQAQRAELQIGEHEFMVLWAGRMDPVKRLEIVIRAAEILNDIPARFVLAGDGPDRARVERLLRTSSAAGRTALPGWQSHLAPLLAAADAFMLPSLTEGTSNALLEAMAAGLAVVAHDIPSIREFATPERARLVAGAEPAAYAAALRGLWAEPQAREGLGRAAAAWAWSTLTEDAAAQATRSIYERVLCGGAGSR